MEVSAELEERYKFTVRNRPYIKGNYYPEDDWEVTVEASTIEELVQKAAEVLVFREVDVDHWYLTRVRYLNYQGEDFCGGEIDVEKEYSNFLQQIKESEYFKTYTVEKLAKDEELRLKKEAESKEKLRQLRYQQFLDLKTEFEPGN